MSSGHVEQFREQGYAVVRGVFSPAEMREIGAEVARIYAEGLRHRASWRHKNLYFEVIDDPQGGHVVLQAHWISWISDRLERLRRDPRYLAILEPLIGGNLKQIANQIHWKPPGAHFVGFRFHQDMRFREPKEAFQALQDSYVTTGLAIDPHRVENGALRVFPGSHKLGYLGLSDDGPLMKGETQDHELRAVGLDPKSAVDVILEPGDIALWSLLTVHGSGPNRSSGDRCFHLNSYVKAANSERGEWAFRNGLPCPLGPEPSLVRYEELYTRPEPHYIEDRWYAE